MSAPVILRNAQDAHITELYKTKNYSTTTTLQIDGSASAQTRYPFIYFSRPFPLKSQLAKGRLRIRQAQAWTGTVTVRVRLATSAWTASRVTWNTQPAVDTVYAELTKTAPGKNTLWDFDIAGLLQRVSDGTVPWYGLRIEVLSTGSRSFYSAQYPTASYRPELEVQWSELPQAPTLLYPSGDRAQSSAKPILRFNFVDTWGDTTLARVNVQISTSASFATPAFDSGWVNATQPELDLNQTSYAGMAEGARIYWRVRVADGSGQESMWSTPTSIRRVAKIMPTIIHPAPAVAPALPYIEDPTPPLAWGFTGTQTAFQVLIVDPDNPSQVFYQGAKITSAEKGHTPPEKAIPDLDDIYRLVLRVWDNVDREATPLPDGTIDQPWSEVWLDFNYNYTTTVGPVTNLQVAVSQHNPGAVLTWDRSSLPDAWAIVRDGKVVRTNIPPTELLVPGQTTKFTFRDNLISGRENHVWYVYAIVNGKTSANNPSITGRMDLLTKWLTDTEGLQKICIWNAEVEMTRGVIENIHRAVGTDPIIIRQSTLGREGTVKGKIVGDQVPNLSATAQRDYFKSMIDIVGKKLVFYNINEAIQIVIYDADWEPVSRSKDIVDYQITFSFFEVTKS